MILQYHQLEDKKQYRCLQYEHLYNFKFERKRFNESGELEIHYYENTDKEGRKYNRGFCEAGISDQFIELNSERTMEEAIIAIDMLLYCNVVYYCSLSFIEALDNEGKFNTHIKRVSKNLALQGEKVSEFTIKKIMVGNDKLSKKDLTDDYCNRSYEIMLEVERKTNMFGSHKYYQCLCALSRLIEETNEQLSSSLKYSGAYRFYNLDKKLSSLKYTPDEMVYRIIKNIDTKYHVY